MLNAAIMWLWTSAAMAGGIPAVKGAVQTTTPAMVEVGKPPILALKVETFNTVYYVECPKPDDAEAAPFKYPSPEIPAGKTAAVKLPFSEPITSAQCVVIANFPTGLSERFRLNMTWTWVEAQPNEDNPSETN